MADLWARLLGVSTCDENETVLRLDAGTEVRFRASEQQGIDGLVEIAVETPAAGTPGRAIEIGDAAVRVQRG